MSDIIAGNVPERKRNGGRSETCPRYVYNPAATYLDQREHPVQGDSGLSGGLLFHGYLVHDHALVQPI